LLVCTKLLAGIALGCTLLLSAGRASAQCVDEELKRELVGKRAYRGVVPRKFKKALRHELSAMGGWYAGDIADGAPIYGGAYTFHFTEDLGLEASFLHTERRFAFIEAVDRAREGVLDIGNTASPVNMYMGHIVWTLAYGKVRWLGGSIGRGRGRRGGQPRCRGLWRVRAQVLLQRLARHAAGRARSGALRTRPARRRTHGQ
jgi:hypothetical protein